MKLTTAIRLKQRNVTRLIEKRKWCRTQAIRNFYTKCFLFRFYNSNLHNFYTTMEWNEGHCVQQCPLKGRERNINETLCQKPVECEIEKVKNILRTTTTNRKTYRVFNFQYTNLKQTRKKNLIHVIYNNAICVFSIDLKMFYFSCELIRTLYLFCHIY